MSQSKFRFADFEFDSETLELFRDGAVQPLKAQSARALLFLLQRPGRLAGREAAAEFIWQGRAVDAVSGINACIRDIRKALEDSAIEPRFIETLPKRGYRFIGRLEGEVKAANVSVSAAWLRPAASIAMAAVTGIALIAGVYFARTYHQPDVSVATSNAAAEPQ